MSSAGGPGINLTPTSYLVLGMVGWLGPSTPYDLKRAVGTTIGNFWPFPHAQLYSEPARLADAGLLEEEREHEGRRRRCFSLTAAGLAALRAWLAEPVAEATEVRDLGLLKLFFAGQGDPADVVALATEQARAHRSRLDAYEALDAELEAGGVRDHTRAALRFGLHVERAAVEFWESVAAGPPGTQGCAPAVGGGPSLGP